LLSKNAPPPVESESSEIYRVSNRIIIGRCLFETVYQNPLLKNEVWLYSQNSSCVAKNDELTFLYIPDSNREIAACDVATIM